MSVSTVCIFLLAVRCAGVSVSEYIGLHVGSVIRTLTLTARWNRGSRFIDKNRQRTAEPDEHQLLTRQYLFV